MAKKRMTAPSGRVDYGQYPRDSLAARAKTTQADPRAEGVGVSTEERSFRVAPEGKRPASAAQFPGGFRDALVGLAETKKTWDYLASRPFGPVVLAQYGLGYAVHNTSDADLLARLGLDTPDQMLQQARHNKAIIDEALGMTLPFYVTVPIGNLLSEAAKSLRGCALSPAMLPCQVGMLWFAEPLELAGVLAPHEAEKFVFTRDDILGKMPPADQERMKQKIKESGGREDFSIQTNPRLQAILWHPVEMAFTDEDAADPGNQHAGIILSCYFRHYPNTVPGIEHIVIDAINYSYELGVVLPYERVDGLLEQGYQGHHNTGMAYAMALWLATMLFVKQKIVVPEPRGLMQEGGDRQRRRAIARDIASGLGRPAPDVQVIRLREIAGVEYDSDTPERRDVQWTCAWLVRGHWRQQPYPSRQVVEPIYIKPFVKNPAGKELRVTQKVAVVSR